jgi:transcriptional regulator GlxA family with amidase domain
MVRPLLEKYGATPDPARVVRDGNTITGGGVTAGIDFALTVASELAGPTIAQMIQLLLEYAPAPPFNSGRPETAPPEVMQALQRRLLPTVLDISEERG